MSNQPVPAFARSWLQQGVEFDENKKSGDFIREIHEQLQPALAEMRPQLEEVKFKFVFLPWFAGDEDLQYFKKDVRESAHAKAMRVWLNVAGSPYHEVDIVDDRSGEILFTVPPLCDNTALRPAQKDPRTGSIYNMVITMQQLQNVSHHHARHFFEAEVSKRSMGMFKPDNLLKFVRTWNEIFTRYGRPPLLELPGLTSPQSAEGNNNGASSISQSAEDWELL
jgi:hypothetical protein